ncbi:hypothetical protein [Streptomyces viridosporus]|nr:hypothetical protein [Streptomyces viridosporus]
MSGDKKTPDPYLEERQEAQAQNGALDAFTHMTRFVSPFGPFSPRGFHFGSTSFEGYDLNDMVDIVESANPALLESAAEALVAASNAIQKAAGELNGNLKGIDWKGESNTAFTKWATSLVETAKGIADYADVVGTQVLAASSGLASVRKSMPPRDTRSNPKAIDDIPEAKRVDSNDEYTAAVKAEKHRQEAINQMYRLASYYTVSAGAMQAAEEPVFPKMPDVGVPLPSPSTGNPIERGAPHEVLTPQGAPESSVRNSMVTAVKEQGPGDQLSALKEADRPVPQAVGTEINSVGTLPPQESMRPTNVAPPSTTGPAAAGVFPPAASGAVPPVFRGTTGRATGSSGAPVTKIPPSVQGRVGGAAGSSPTARTGPGPLGQSPRAATPGSVGGRGTGPLGQVGRTAMPGQAESRGTGPVGRGIIGGMPRSGGAATGQVGSVPRSPMGTVGATPPSRSGSGRTNDGVVGGRPVTGAAPGGNNSRPPRGTVIGGEGVPGPRTTGQRPGQHGVIGAPPATPNTGQAPRRSVSSPDGVVGTPNGMVPGTRNNGRTSEGSGAQRGAAGNRGSSAGRSRRDERRDTSATD